MTPATIRALDLERSIASEPKRLVSYTLVVNGREQHTALQTLADAERAAALFLADGTTVGIRSSDGSYKTFSLQHLPS